MYLSWTAAGTACSLAFSQGEPRKAHSGSLVCLVWEAWNIPFFSQMVTVGTQRLLPALCVPPAPWVSRGRVSQLLAPSWTVFSRCYIRNAAISHQLSLFHRALGQPQDFQKKPANADMPVSSMCGPPVCLMLCTYQFRAACVPLELSPTKFLLVQQAQTSGFT